MKLLLASLALVALPVMAAEPTLYGRYEYIQLPEIGRNLQGQDGHRRADRLAVGP